MYLINLVHSVTTEVETMTHLLYHRSCYNFKFFKKKSSFVGRIKDTGNTKHIFVYIIQVLQYFPCYFVKILPILIVRNSYVFFSMKIMPRIIKTTAVLVELLLSDTGNDFTILLLTSSYRS